MSKLSKIAQDGIWKQNPALVKLLGLGPLLAVSNSFVTALCLGIVIVIVLTTSNILISFIRFFKQGLGYSYENRSASNPRDTCRYLFTSLVLRIASQDWTLFGLDGY